MIYWILFRFTLLMFILDVLVAAWFIGSLADFIVFTIVSSKWISTLRKKLLK